MGAGGRNYDFAFDMALFQGEFWIVGGDLTTMQSGVIITPQSWQVTSTLQVQAW